MRSGASVAHFHYHTAPITSIDWNPNDSSVIAVSSADNQVSLWDMSVEIDTEAEGALDGNVVQGTEDLPPQLLFLHQGQKDVKEVHWHPQLPGVLMTTAADGLNVFKACNM